MYMIRTTILLPLELKKKVESKAKERGISLGEFIRLSIQEAISPKKNQIEKDPFFSDSEFYEGNMPSDISLNHDEYLFGGKS